MKKLICILLSFVILISLCACGGDPTQNTDTSAATEASTEASEPAVQAPDISQGLTPEQLYGHINQLEPVDGIYKIWSEVGVQNMVNHPDATFELLCNVDMGGATVTPIGTADKPFTGEIKGANFAISNFTVQGGEEADFGFVGVNQGNIHNFLIQNVTFIPGANAKNIGALVGANEGIISRCTVTGTMTVEAAAENAACGAAAGISSGEISNTVTTVDIAFTAPDAATVGGIAGIVTGGTVEFTDANGKLDITGTNKVAGLLLGSAKDVQIKNCAFVGASNTVDGVLFTDYFGAEENVTSSTLLWRDNSREPEKAHIQALREKAVQAMYEICTITWYPEQNIVHNCNCSLNICNGTYGPSYNTYYGIPYNHKGGSLARMKYCLNEDGTIKDWVYELAEEGSFDTFDLYMGNDCSTAVQQAWLTISNSIEFKRSSYQAPAVAELRNTGVLPVGEWEWDIGLDVTSAALISKNYTEHNGVEVMYEAYAQLRMGDGVTYYFENGHSRMCATDAVVVRDENGKINGEYSYVVMHEQGKEVIDVENNTYSTCAVNQKYTFDNLYSGYYLPITIKELATGEVDVPTCTLEGGVDGSRLGLTTGVLKANYSLDYVVMVITDEQGNEVFNHTMFPTVTKRLDNNSNDTQIRNVIMEYDLAGFAIPLREVSFKPGATYHATITGNLATGDSFQVKDFSFTNG